MSKGVFAILAFLYSASMACGAEGWIEGEYLLWSIKKNPVASPLLTIASFSDPLPGAIGQPGTQVVLGKHHFDMDWISGFRVGIGGKLGSHFGIEGSYFLLPTVTKKKRFGTSGEPGALNFAVPIFDVTGVCGLNGVPGETIFILPGPLEAEPGFLGTFNFTIASRLQGASCNAIYSQLKKHFHYRGIGGFRWFELHEFLILKAKTHTAANVSFPAGFFNFSDRFATSNNFLSLQIGIGGGYQSKRWVFDAEFIGALGALLEQIKIKGSSRTSAGNLFFKTQGTANETLHGGIFAEPTNMLKHNKNCLAVAFETCVSAGYKLTQNLEIDLGYTFFWLNKVIRPGDQIDRKINTTLTALADASRSTVGTGPGPIPFGDSSGAPAPRGPKKPSPLFKTSSFYVQGLNAGITFKF